MYYKAGQSALYRELWIMQIYSSGLPEWKYKDGNEHNKFPFIQVNIINQFNHPQN